jgi:hypothetical protein
MRMLGMFFGRATRNDNYKLDDPHPINTYTDSQCCGNAGLDGFTVLSRADPDRQGDPPNVKGTAGRVYRGPDNSFEQ